MTDDTFLTTEEVIDYLQVNLRTVYRLIKAGKIPAVRVGRQWRFRKGDLDAWLETERRGVRLSPAVPQRAPRTAAHRVLVADDEESIRELLARTLALAEYDVETVGDARAALDRLRLADYDLLIADLRMPGMDGLLLVREARRLHPTCPSSSSRVTPAKRAPSRPSTWASSAISSSRSVCRRCCLPLRGRWERAEQGRRTKDE